MKIFYSKKFLDFENNDAECPERLKEIVNYLKEKKFGDFEEPSSASENDLLLVHFPSLVERVKKFSEREVSFPDNAFHKNTYEIALLSAGSAINAAFSCFDAPSFSLCRPPGHHATKNSFGGFCYFNNIAIASAKLLKEKKAEKILIIDFDAHHGNGTQDIFYNEKSVFYLSLHQFPAYPGTGSEKENNEHVLNVPLAPRTSGREYLKRFDDALEKAMKFKPDVIGVSAGFDSYEKDPLVSLKLKTDDYGKIGKRIASAGLPVFIVLEGGYFLPDLGKNVYEFLREF